jgi:hypothetical protein
VSWAECRECGEVFASDSGFDKHRVGKHAYTFREGLKMDPFREDGRRCLDTDELAEKGWRKDKYNRWRTPSGGRDASLAFPRRSVSPSEAEEVSGHG